jgi:hypothetical protein
MARAVLDDDRFAELREALADLPLRDGEAAFSRIAGAFLKHHRAMFDFAAGPEPLTDGEARALAEVGARATAGQPDATPLVQAAASHGALVATAVPIAEAAGRLGVTGGRLRQRVAEGSLLAIRSPDGRRLLVPAFQLTAAGELPGLRRVLKALRRDLSVLRAAAFFATPQPDLEAPDGAPTSPVDWLLAGQDPEAVAAIARLL